MKNLIDSIRQHEGFKSEPYLDTVGVPTIGIGHAYPGRTLEQVMAMYPVGVTLQQAEEILMRDLEAARKGAWGVVRNFDAIDQARQEALIELAFNLGPQKLANFRKMLAAVNDHRWGEAAVQLCDSKWWSDVKPRRALHLASQLITGIYWQNLFSG